MSPAAGWYPVALSAGLERGTANGTHLFGRELVTWRDGDGAVHVWEDRCPHRGMRLSFGFVRDNRLACLYHGWTYDSAGRCVHIPAHPDQPPPAKARVTSYQARLAYDLVWVALGQPQADVPPFPEWGDPAYRKIFCGPYTVAASGPRIVENFLDMAHFPFVHAGVLGAETHTEVRDYTVTAKEDGIEVTNCLFWQPAATPGSTIGPCAESAYAVEPVAVATIRPSARSA